MWLVCGLKATILVSENRNMKESREEKGGEQVVIVVQNKHNTAKPIQCTIQCTIHMYSGTLLIWRPLKSGHFIIIQELIVVPNAAFAC